MSEQEMADELEAFDVGAVPPFGSMFNALGLHLGCECSCRPPGVHDLPCCHSAVTETTPSQRPGETDKRAPLCRPFSAPREIRTPTVQTDHKALNLARLSPVASVPEQAMMTEKAAPAKHAESRRGEATKEERRREDRSRGARPAEVRNLVERQRETFNQVAKWASGRGYPDPGRQDPPGSSRIGSSASAGADPEQPLGQRD